MIKTIIEFTTLAIIVIIVLRYIGLIVISRLADMAKEREARKIMEIATQEKITKFNVGSYLDLSTNNNPANVKNIRCFDEAKSKEWIEANL